MSQLLGHQRRTTMPLGKNASSEMIEIIEDEMEEIVKLLCLAGEVRDLITEHAGARELDDLVGRFKPNLEP
jgi:hypothetical protein